MIWFVTNLGTSIKMEQNFIMDNYYMQSRARESRLKN
jgi:hypothetical protein